MKSQARIETAKAGRYLGQLAKHFANTHDMPVEFDAQRGRIEHPLGICELAATDTILTIRLIVEEDGDLGRLEAILAEHLQRVAFRDPPRVQWIRDTE